MIFAEYLKIRDKQEEINMGYIRYIIDEIKKEPTCGLFHMSVFKYLRCAINPSLRSARAPPRSLRAHQLADARDTYLRPGTSSPSN
jgi:hypothetical protein